MCIVHNVHSVKDYHSTCVDAVGVFSADGVAIVADDGEPRIICMLEFSMSYILYIAFHATHCYISYQLVV